MGAAAAGLSIASTLFGGYSKYKQGEANESYYNELAKESDKQAPEVLKAAKSNVGMIQESGSRQTQEVIGDVKGVMGSQKTALAAGNIALSSGTAEDIARDTFNKGLKDEAAIRYNADISAWKTTTEARNKALNLESQADAYRKAGKAAKDAGTMGGLSTLLGGVTSLFK